MSIERQPSFKEDPLFKRLTERPPSSERELFLLIIEAGKNLQKRDPIQDMKDYLAIRGVSYAFEFINRPNPNIPVLLTPNHYCRSQVERRGFSTTGELFLTTAVTTLAFQNLSERKTVWVVKKLSEKFLGIKRLDRSAQNAMPICYDFIPATSIRLFKESRQALQNGINLGFYPEQNQPFSIKNVLDPNQNTLREYHPGFKVLLAELARKQIDYQILPASVYTERGIFMVRFGQVINPKDYSKPEELADLTMKLIAGGLPRRLRGKYA